jgi:hypothetical protein
MCANALYLNDTLRNSWGFDGYVTSDVRPRTPFLPLRVVSPVGKD